MGPARARVRILRLERLRACGAKSGSFFYEEYSVVENAQAVRLVHQRRARLAPITSSAVTPLSDTGRRAR